MPRACGSTRKAGRIYALIEGARRQGLPPPRQIVADVVARDDEQRFAPGGAGRRIRANQGHPIAVDLGLAARPPPAMLCHGTATRHVRAIRRAGLQPRAREHVHPPATRELAWQVGARRGLSAALEIDAQGRREAGHAFHRSADGVRPTGHVPPRSIRLPAHAARGVAR